MHSQKRLALLALAVVFPGVTHAQTQLDVPTRMTHQPDFGIPFQLAPNSAGVPSEVQLYVSAQQGRDWKLHQKRPTNASGFQFRAPADGEYWFAVRTVDARGELISHHSWQPELKVVVDTRLPRLDLRLNVDATGLAVAEWVAQDPNLAPHTFRMQYQDGNGQWQDVPVETPSPDDWRQEWQGRARWRLTVQGRELLVRAEILDRAGNVTTVNKTVSLAQAATAQTNRFDNTTGQSSPAEPSSFAGDRAEAHDWGTPTKQLDDRLPSWLTEIQHTDNAFGAAPVRKLARRRAEDQATISSNIEPPVASRFQKVVQPQRAPEIRPRITASPNFALEYELIDVGPMGVRMVELWCTRDRGATWELYGSDADKLSPLEVRVKKEGLYGFRLVVHGHNAETPRPPDDGESADIWVGVDWTKPFARIHRAAYGVGAERDTILIQWQAEDALLSELPIALNYAASPQGPWMPIRAGLPNSGSYRWRPGESAPSQLYLQIEVSDLAGNVTTTEYASPVTRRGAAPRGLIRGMRPLEQASTFEPFSQR